MSSYFEKSSLYWYLIWFPSCLHLGRASSTILYIREQLQYPNLNLHTIFSGRYFEMFFSIYLSVPLFLEMQPELPHSLYPTPSHCPWVVNFDHLAQSVPFDHAVILLRQETVIDLCGRWRWWMLASASSSKTLDSVRPSWTMLAVNPSLLCSDTCNQPMSHVSHDTRTKHYSPIDINALKLQI